VFVCILPGKAIFEMTYTVSSGTLNPTHSHTHSVNIPVWLGSWVALLCCVRRYLAVPALSRCSQLQTVSAGRVREATGTPATAVPMPFASPWTDRALWSLALASTVAAGLTSATSSYSMM